MKFTVIGYWGGYPNANGASAGYLLELDGFSLLIDCGSAVLSQLQNVIAPEKLDAVILSHYHADHTADIGVLQHARHIQGFITEKPKLLPIYGHGEDEFEFAKLTYKDVSIGVAYNPKEILQVGPFEISFLKTVHPVDCYAMRMSGGGKTIVYTGDTAYTEALVPFSERADLLVSECNFYGWQNMPNAGHMNSVEVGKLATAAQVKQLLLTHLPHYGEMTDLVTEAKEYYDGKISLAKTRLVIELKA